MTHFLNLYDIVYVYNKYDYMYGILGHFPTSQMSLGQIPTSNFRSFSYFPNVLGQIRTSNLGHFPTSVLGLIPNSF